MREEILDFADVQKFQERFHIPFTSSITRWTYEVLNAIHSEGVDEITLVLADTILPTSYKKNSWMWINNILKGKVKYQYLVCRHESNTVVLTASDKPIEQSTFRNSLVARLQQEERISFDEEEVPFAYRKNPYTLAWRLRVQGKSNVKASRIGDKIIFTRQ